MQVYALSSLWMVVVVVIIKGELLKTNSLT